MLVRAFYSEQSPNPVAKHRRRKKLAGFERQGQRPVLEWLEHRVVLSVNIIGSYATGLNLANDTQQDAPDPQGAAGPSAFVTTMYTDDQNTDPSIAIFPDKTTNANPIESTLASFWTTAGGLPRADTNGTESFYHPAVVWDDIIQRFIIGESDFADQSEMGGVEVEDIAVSKTDSPKTLTKSDWNFYQIPNTEINETNLTNFPGPYDADTVNWGYNADEVVYSYSVQSTTTKPQHKLVVAISQQDLANGVSQANLHVGNNDITWPQRLRPAVMHDSQTGDPMWLVSEDANGTTIDVFKATNLLTSGKATFTRTSLNVMPYQDASGITPKGTTGAAIDGTVDSSIMQAAEYGGKLAAAQAVTNSAGDRTMIRWYEVDVSGSAPTLSDQGEIDDSKSGAGQAGVYDMYPSVDINSAGTIGLSYVQSGTSAGQYLSMYVTGRAATDPASTMAAPQIVPSAMGAGNPSDQTTAQGTFSGMSLDSDGTFWATNYYVDSNGIQNTAVAHFSAGPSGGSPSGNWVPEGPAPIVGGPTAGHLPISGRITGIATDPVDVNTIFIATAGGGVWRTTDLGAHWTPLTDYLTDTNGNPIPEFMGAIAETRDSNGNEVVYAGTGEANGSTDSFYGEGILVSFDGGSTWALQNDNGKFYGATVAKIAIDPSDPSGKTVYAAVDANAFVSPQLNESNVPKVVTGIYKSTDGGKTWTDTTAGLPISSSDTWSDLWVDPRQPNLVYAADGTVGGGPSNGVYWSQNAGGKWQPLTTYGGVATLLPFGSNVGRIALAGYDDGVTQELVISMAGPKTSSATSAGLYKFVKLTQTNGHVTVQDLTSNLSNYNYLGNQGWYDTTLAISPGDPNYIYASGQQSSQSYNAISDFFGHGSPIESFDGGMSWNDISANSVFTGTALQGPHTDSHAVAFDRNLDVIEGDDGGVFLLNHTAIKDDQTWSSLNSDLQITQFTGIAVNPSNTSQIIGGSQDNGTEETSGTYIWTNIYGGDGGVVRISPKNSSVVYTETPDTGFFVSTDGGASFTSIDAGIKSTSKAMYPSYVLDANGAIYYGTDYLNYSNNQGTSWSQIGQPGVQGFNTGGKIIQAVAVASNNNNVVYVSTGFAMFVTTNAQAGAGKVTWSQLVGPIGGALAIGPYSIAVDPSDASGASSYAVRGLFSTSGHVFKRTSLTGGWIDITGDLPDTPVNAIALSPDGKTIYVGTDVGVYYSTNGGAHWAQLSTGLPHAQVVDIEVLNNGKFIAAATHGRGVWVFDGESGLAPHITSTNTTTFNVGPGGVFPITIQGIGSTTITVAGTGGNQLPSWVTLASGLSGADLDIAPQPGSGGAYQFTITANDGTVPNDVQTFNLFINEAPLITSANNATFYEGIAGSFTITTGHSYPTPVTMNILDDLPSGLKFTDNGDGTASITGTPAAGTAKTYAISFTAYNAADMGTRQDFTLTIATATPTQQYVAAAFEDVLERPVDPDGLSYWSSQIDGGQSRTVVAALIDHSAEYFGKIIITPAYQKYLGRTPDAAGLAYWVDQMQNDGLTDERLEAGFIGSAEFYQHAGGTDTLWVDAMYLDLLGRPADGNGESYWTSQLAAGTSRADVAYGFADSLERESQRITDDYMHYLGRGPDSNGLSYWLNQFANGTTNEDLITGFVGSDEYYQRHTT